MSYLVNPSHKGIEGDLEGIYFILPPFHNVGFSSITHIYIEVNESKHIYMPRFINIYMNMCNARKYYIVKRRNYLL